MMEERSIRRRFLASALVSIAILSGAIAWAYRIGETANGVSHALDHRQDELSALREMVKAKL